MNNDGKLEMFLNEIPQMAASSNHHLHNNNQFNRHVLLNVSPICSGSFSGGLFYSDGGSSPSLIPCDETVYRTASARYWDPLVVENRNEPLLNDLSLSESLYKMHIRDEHNGHFITSRFGLHPDENGVSDSFSPRISPCQVERYSPHEGLTSDISDTSGSESSLYRPIRGFPEDRMEALLGSGGSINVDSVIGSYLANHGHSKGIHSGPLCHENNTDNLLRQTEEQRRSFSYRGIPLQSSSVHDSYVDDDFPCSVIPGIDPNGDWNMHKPLNPSPLMHSKLAFSKENSKYNCSLLKQKGIAMQNGGIQPSLRSMEGTEEIDAFFSDDSFILQGKSLKSGVDKKSDRPNGGKKTSHNGTVLQVSREGGSPLQSCSNSVGVLENGSRRSQFQVGGIDENGSWRRSSSPMLLQARNRSLAEYRGFIYVMSKDQLGCRFLQRLFDEGSCEDVQTIFDEIINHVIELMMDQFGNYLVQKLLDVCTEEQRMQIVLVVTKEPGQLVRISLNAHGTRAVQKLIESLKTRQQISVVIQALKPGFLDLIKDLNGNHVLQRCLQCLGKEYNKFIYKTAAKFCVDVATHRYGCCVLNLCIAHSTGKYREILAAEISSNGLVLAQDAFGNYVVQYILELKIPSAAAKLVSKFSGHFVSLSKQKFSSHVVEKCLKCFEESRSRIVHELLSVSYFDQLLQDPFANYVIQSALAVTKGHLHTQLAAAVQSHTTLRTSPYCKKIFSRNLLKK